MKKLKGYTWILILVVLLLILAGLIIGLFRMSIQNDEEKTIVGGVFLDDIDDGGWSENHYNGLKTACDALGLKLEVVTNVEEKAASEEAAVEELVSKGCNVIFLTSEGYGMDMYPVMAKYNNVEFYTVSPHSDLSNVTTYFCRLYEMRYLAGMIAGRMTQSNILGYVAGGRNPQVTRGINAFTLGARSVNQDVTVKVRYLDNWTDPEDEYLQAKKLITEDGADLITYHASLNTAIDAAEELGAYSVGYGMDIKGYSDKCLTSVIYHWDVVYRKILEDFLKGAITDNHYYFLGMREGAVSFTDVTNIVPPDVKLLVDAKRKEFAKGSFVFEGEIISNTGKVMCRKGERISDDALLRRMNWFVEGVEVYG
jgi:basic membrane lipoprotein Med (substrate-binding protein (PBP1-ABC) superfamily)